METDRQSLVSREPSDPPQPWKQPSAERSEPQQANEDETPATLNAEYSNELASNGPRPDDSNGAEQITPTAVPPNGLFKCNFCRKPIVPGTETPSCDGGDAVVHRDCVQDERIQAKIQLNLERGTRRAVMARTEHHYCLICQRQEFVKYAGNPGVVLRDDVKWINPCFCEVYFHHACLAAVVRERRSCPQCGVKYSFRVYGSLLHFITRYWLSYMFIAATVGLLCLFAVYTMVNTIAYPVPTWPSGRIALLIIGLFLTAIALCCLGTCLRYTFGYRVPRFKNKYGFVRVRNYRPGDRKRQSDTSAGSSRRITNRCLLSRSLHSEELSSTDWTGVYPVTSTPKVAGASVPLDFNTPSFRASLSPKITRKIEEHPLRLTLACVQEENEGSYISYDDTKSDERETRPTRV